MKKFLEDLKKELNNYSIIEEEVQDILSDHENMIREAMVDGLKEEDIPTKFGDPKELAKELASSSTKIENKTNIDAYNLIKSFEDVELEKALLRTVSDDLTVETHDKNNIEVFMKGIKDSTDYDITYKDSVLKLAYTKKRLGFFMSSNKNGTVLVKVPKKLILEEADLSVVSGDCIVSNLNSKLFTISSTSGDAKMNTIRCSKLKAKTVSGDIGIKDLNTGKAQLTTVSGDYKLTNSTIETDLDMNTVSGDYGITDVECEKLFFSSVSGGIKAKDFYPNNISFKSVSGDLEINNSDKDRKINIAQNKSLSGEIKIK